MKTIKPIDVREMNIDQTVETENQEDNL